VFIVQAYQTSQYVVPRSGIFHGKWRGSFAGSSDVKMNVQSACALSTRYHGTWAHLSGVLHKSSLRSVCLYPPPPIVPRQRLGTNVTAATNAHAKIGELLGASFSIRPVSWGSRWFMSHKRLDAETKWLAVNCQSWSNSLFLQFYPNFLVSLPCSWEPITGPLTLASWMHFYPYAVRLLINFK
jgi:hypothetical protein